MRDATNIAIEQAIVHIIDPHGPGQIVLSDLPLDLAANQELHDYFVAHFVASLRDEQTRGARFVPAHPTSAASQHCQALLDHAASLVPASQQLAAALGGIVQSNRAISPGLFAVCQYTCDCSTPAPRFVALLKLDLNRVFQPRIERRAGRVSVGCELSAEALPGKDERLQKVAFIRSTTAGPGRWDLLLLDRQVEGGALQAVARFFIDDFLGAELAWTAEARTAAAHKALWKVKRHLVGRLSDQQVEEFAAAIDTALRAPRFNRDAFFTTQGLDGALRQQAVAIMERALPDIDFDTDPAYGDKALKWALFKGDAGLRLFVDARTAAQVIKQEQVQLQSGQIGWRVTFTTEQWERVKSR